MYKESLERLRKLFGSGVDKATELIGSGVDKATELIGDGIDTQIEKQINPEMVTNSLSQASKETFSNPASAKGLAKDLTKSQISGSGDPQQTIKKYTGTASGTGPGDVFKEEAGSAIFEDVAKQIPTSSSWNLPTGAAINLGSSSGDIGGFLGNKFQSWVGKTGAADVNNLSKDWGETLGQQFQGSASTQQAANNIAGMAQKGVSQSINQNASPMMSTAYNFLSGDFGGFVNSLKGMLGGSPTDVGGDAGEDMGGEQL